MGRSSSIMSTLPPASRMACTPRCCFQLAVQREGDRHDGPAARAVLGPDPAAMRLDNPLADGQPQPCARPAALACLAIRFCTFGGAAIELLEYPLAISLEDARTAVQHLDPE